MFVLSVELLSFFLPIASNMVVNASLIAEPASRNACPTSEFPPLRSLFSRFARWLDVVDCFVQREREIYTGM